MRRTHIHLLATIAVALLVTAGCRNTNAGAGGTDAPPSIPDVLPEATTTTVPAATTTTVATDEQAAYNVYRIFLDASLAIGRDFSRDPADGSLAPYTTPAYRQQIEANLQGLKRNGLRTSGQMVTRLLSSSVPKPNQLILEVCLRDDVDQFDRTGKQLTEPGIGIPQVEKVGLVKEGSIWLVDASIQTEAPCDV